MATSTTTVEFNEGRIINADEVHPVLCLVYDSITGTWQPMSQPGGGGGGGGGPVTIANGADIVEGQLADAAIITDAAGTVNGKLRGLVKWAFERMPVSLGQKLMAASFPVTIASDQSTLKVLPSDGAQDNTFKALNVQVVGTDVGLVTNTVIHGLTTAGGGSYVDVKVNPSGALTVDATGSIVGAAQSGAWAVGRTWALSTVTDSIVIADGGGSITVDGTVAITAAALPLPAGAATEATLATRLAEATFTTRIPVNGQATMAASIPVVIASNQSAIAVTGPLTDTQLRAAAVPTKETRSGTNTRTSVAAAVADTVILASNANRLGATVYNDSTANLFLALGTAAASLTDFTVRLVPNAYYEVPFDYTGGIRGIWSAAAGNARVGELT